MSFGRSDAGPRRALVALGAIAGLGRLGAQPGPEYGPGCLAFTESVRTAITSHSGSATVENRAGRDGVVVIRIDGRRDSLGLVAWFDSLDVWRETSAGREVPDVEGFLGGRYRGLVTPDGRYTPTALPFVPSEIQDVADLESIMDDFLPRLAPRPLEPGRQWSDSTGLSIRRGADLKDRSGPIERYTWTWTHRLSDPADPDDSTAVALEQQVRDEGELRWSVRAGPIGWTRHLSISAKVPARGAIKRSVQSLVDQTITVTRRFGDPSCADRKGER